LPISPSTTPTTFHSPLPTTPSATIDPFLHLTCNENFCSTSLSLSLYLVFCLDLRLAAHSQNTVESVNVASAGIVTTLFHIIDPFPSLLQLCCLRPLCGQARQPPVMEIRLHRRSHCSSIGGCSMLLVKNFDGFVYPILYPQCNSFGLLSFSIIIIKKRLHVNFLVTISFPLPSSHHSPLTTSTFLFSLPNHHLNQPLHFFSCLFDNGAYPCSNTFSPYK